MRANFAVCDPVAGVESIAESMCPGCVQILLGRWHVIKDRQHLWLHERGACGCTIPGSAIPTAVGPMGHGMPAPQYTTVGTFASQQGYAQASTYGQQPQHDYAQVPTYEQRPPHGYARVPTYEQRVAENPTPELFAVSWAREHRLRHDAGLCNCHIDFTPVAQTIFQEDVRDSLRSIRRRENRIRERYGRGELSVQDAVRALEVLSVGEHRAMRTRIRQTTLGSPISLDRYASGNNPTQVNQRSTGRNNGRAPRNGAPRPAGPDVRPPQEPRAMRNQTTTPVQTESQSIYMTPGIAPGTQHTSGHTPRSAHAVLQRAPVCGFPIGAGPDCTVPGHIPPPWENCMLARWGRRPASR